MLGALGYASLDELTAAALPPGLADVRRAAAAARRPAAAAPATSQALAELRGWRAGTRS